MAMKNKKFWQFIRNEATAEQPESLELRIDGVIADDDDAWIYEWFDMKATSPNAFREELNQYKGKNMDLVVWIDSYGGDVFAAAGIYNALKEYDGKITVKIDGKAMSAASVIAMAGDEILMSPIGIMMIHNPLSSVQGYASDMRKEADVLDTIKESIINAYASKTQKSRDKISAMMDDETYMSANVAVKEGFADRVLYQEGEEETQNVMNFAYNRLTIQNSANEVIKHLSVIENKLKTDNPIITHNEKEEIIMDSKELKEKYPDVYNAVFAEGKTEGITEGTTTERERIKNLDDLSGKIDNDFLTKAKYEEPSNAEKVALQAMKEDKMVNTAYLNDIKKDAKNANKVDGDAPLDPKDEEDVTILSTVKNIADKTVKSLKGVK